jgi:hypothetical protein
VIAIRGVNAWRSEHSGKRKMEVAEEAIACIRSPFGFEGEGKTRKSGKNETSEEKRALDSAFVLIERYQAERESFAKIYAMRFRFIALFGVESVKPFDTLNQVVNKLLAGVHESAVFPRRWFHRHEWATASKSAATSKNRRTACRSQVYQRHQFQTTIHDSHRQSVAGQQ